MVVRIKGRPIDLALTINPRPLGRNNTQNNKKNNNAIVIDYRCSKDHPCRLIHMPPMINHPSHTSLSTSKWRNSAVLTAFGCGFLLSQGLQALWRWQTTPTATGGDGLSFALPDAETSCLTVYQQKLRESKAQNHLNSDNGSTHMHAFDVLARHAYRALTQSPTEQLSARPSLDLSHWPFAEAQGGLLDPDRRFLASVYQRAQSVLEWGLGESTHIAAAVGVPRYTGLDSDPAFVNATRNAVTSKSAAHFRFVLADIGEVGDWGMPHARLPKNTWSYQVAPLLAEPEAFDVYMVDGRYRLACLAAAFLHASWRQTQSNSAASAASPTIVLVHDCDRAIYHVADALLEKTESGGLLCQYTRRPGTTDAQLLDLWMQHLVDVA